jgi:cytidine deaminase
MAYSGPEALRDLFQAAETARSRAYAPYSRFPVGAAIRTADGTIVAGCNVENAAYTTQCAEATAIGAMVAGGARRIAEILVMGGQEGDGVLCTPCGLCRQRIREFAAPDTPVHVCGPEGHRMTATLGEILPWSFGPENLRAS